MKLTASKNQCGGCRQYFNSNSAFVKHRTGTYGVNRRCLNEEEMRAKKMQKNAAGYWTGEPMDQSTLERRYAVHKQT